MDPLGIHEIMRTTEWENEQQTEIQIQGKESLHPEQHLDLVGFYYALQDDARRSIPPHYLHVLSITHNDISYSLPHLTIRRTGHGNIKSKISESEIPRRPGAKKIKRSSIGNIELLRWRGCRVINGLEGKELLLLMLMVMLLLILRQGLGLALHLSKGERLFGLVRQEECMYVRSCCSIWRQRRATG